MLDRLVLYNFKSYRGEVTIGPLTNFTSILGPNGAGKSNVMDALCFCLGVRTSHLRSSNLADLVYRGGRLSDVLDTNNSAEDNENSVAPDHAWVEASYIEPSTSEVHRFRRTISIAAKNKQAAVSEYRLNGAVVTYTAYSTALERYNLFVKARNFLIFQGDVESVGTQRPSDLTNLIEIVCGSAELKQDYARLALEYEQAKEAGTTAMHNKRLLKNDLKQIRQQKTEADAWFAKRDERDELTRLHILWKLWRFETRINELTDRFSELAANRTAAERAHQQAEKDVAESKKEQAVSHTQVLKTEKKLKESLKLVEAKVALCCSFDIVCLMCFYSAQISWRSKKKLYTQSESSRPYKSCTTY